ncbi:SMC-Scp complex subunit ScpB, partial [Thermodesulfobium sp.]
MKDYKKIIEAIIFLNIKPTKVENISKLLEIEPNEVKNLIAQLNDDYKERSFKIYCNS